jgi:O-antigen ligase
LAVALIAGAWLTRRELERGERVWAVGAILAGTVLVASYADLNAVMYRFDQTLASGYADRHVIWRETLPILRSFWMSGTGAGTFPTAMLAYQRSDRTFFFNQAHNHYLQLATEGGLLLGIPVISSLAALLLSARRRLTLDRTAVYWVRAGAVAGLAAVACQSIWETGLRMPANAVLCAILAAVAVHERHPAEFERGAS